MRDGSWSRQRTKSGALESQVGEALREASSSRKSPPQWLCHHCRRSASAFVRLSALGPTSHRGKNGPGEGALYVAVHPDRATPVNPATFRHSSHGGTCCSPPPTAVVRRARLYSPIVGSRQSNVRSESPHPTAHLRFFAHRSSSFAIFARILTAANKELCAAVSGHETLGSRSRRRHRRTCNLCHSVS
jgi:hypothetical protein